MYIYIYIHMSKDPRYTCAHVFTHLSHAGVLTYSYGHTFNVHVYVYMDTL